MINNGYNKIYDCGNIIFSKIYNDGPIDAEVVE